MAITFFFWALHVAAMERFIENPALISLMGKRSREIAEEKFDVDKVNAFLLSIIE